MNKRFWFIYRILACFSLKTSNKQTHKQNNIIKQGWIDRKTTGYVFCRFSYFVKGFKNIWSCVILRRNLGQGGKGFLTLFQICQSPQMRNNNQDFYLWLKIPAPFLILNLLHLFKEIFDLTVAEFWQSNPCPIAAMLSECAIAYLLRPEQKK